MLRVKPMPRTVHHSPGPALVRARSGLARRARSYASRWRRWHGRGAVKRVLLKLAAFLLVVAVALYPKPWLIPSWASRWANLGSLIEPDHPALAALEAELGAGPRREGEALRAQVQQVVLRRLPYAWDWQTWGVMDYIPTVGEALALGREDCDGRAVVAASLLARCGVPATLETDFRHVWVSTPDGDLMGPTGGARTIRSTPGGTRVRVTAGTLTSLLDAIAFGIGVFPLGRELLIVGAMVLLTWHPRVAWPRGAVGAVSLLASLALIRAVHSGSGDPPAGGAWLVWAGSAAAVAGWGLIAWRARRAGGSPSTDAASTC